MWKKLKIKISSVKGRGWNRRIRRKVKKKGEGKRRVKKEEMLGECTTTAPVPISRPPVMKKTGNVRVKSMRVRVTNVAVEKQQAINMSVSVFLHYLTGMQSASAVCQLWPTPLYKIFPHYLTNGMIFGGGGGSY